MANIFYRLFISFLVLPVFSNAQNFGGNAASTQWRQLQSATARVVFPQGLDSQAQRMSNMLQLLDTTTLYSIGTKIRKWDIVLLHQNTAANAFVRLAPAVSELYMVPSQNNFSNGSLRWDDNLLIHESRHIQQFSNFNHGFTKLFSFLFGQEGQLLANGLTIPDYFFEGDAVWQETLVSKQGRGRMPSFFNGIKALWLSNKKYSWMQLRNGSLRKFVPDHYQLGYPVVLYGYEKYGSDFWRKVTSDAVDFKGLFYPFNKAVKKYSGKPYQQFTNDALAYFKEQVLQNSTANSLNFITPVSKNNVADYLFPHFISDDSIIVTKQSYRELNSFYLLVNGREKKLRVKDYVLDDYFSYSAGKLVYAAYQSHPIRQNINYSSLKLLDIYTNQQVQLTTHGNYFSPALNSNGSQIIAVKVNDDGSNCLHRIDAASGQLLQALPNPENYFFTQTKFINDSFAVAAVRSPAGKMALVKVGLTNGDIEPLTIFSYAVIGYPFVKDGLVYFTMADGKAADRIFAVSLHSKQLYRLTDNINGVYQPTVNNKGQMLVVAATADGNRLAQVDIKNKLLQEVSGLAISLPIPAAYKANEQKGFNSIDKVVTSTTSIAKYSKLKGLFNFHSARPFVDEPEMGYTIYSDNTLANWHSEISYTFNRNEHSHAVGYSMVYSGLFPFMSAGVQHTFNRELLDTANIIYQFNATKLFAGFYMPFNFVNGRNFTQLNLGSYFNTEYVPFDIEAKEVVTKPLHYLSSFIGFSNRSRVARQFINPHWAQEFSITYRNAFSIINNRKLVADAAFYFPGLLPSHSLVVDGAYQRRDSLADFFSRTFSFARGYQELNQRRMYKLGINYHFPLCYPDWGFANILFVQRVRVNAFFDYGSSLTKFTNNRLIDIKTRSTGAELRFDTKWWNALPVSFGIRYSRLLDNDLLNAGAKNRWEIIVPVNFIPD